MLDVAIVGCGKIADAHLEALQKVKGCRVVGACDREELMAKQLSERFGINGYYADVAEMLSGCNPDVVHITTPPQIQFDIARQCIESDCHVYVEKPFGINATEAKKLIDLAESKNRKLTIGHDLQFSPVARRMRELVKSGYLGGRPLHMESYYCYDLSDPVYARALLADKNHWVRRLPGRLLHNIINHGVARIAEYMECDEPKVIAHGFISPLLNQLGEKDIIDELRVIISDGVRTTAYFTFSSQMRPSLNHFQIFGPQNGLESDEDHQTLIKHVGSRYKSYAERFIPPVKMARQQVGNLVTNMQKFLCNDFHMKSGMTFLINAFYRSINNSTPLPISYREILLTARILDAIFDQLYGAEE